MTSNSPGSRPTPTTTPNKQGGKGGHSSLGDQVRNPGKAPDAGQPPSERRD